MSDTSAGGFTKQIKNIKLWKSLDKAFYLSHNQGLNQDQIDFLRSLQLGDKLIAFTEKDVAGRDLLTMKKSTMLPRLEPQDSIKSIAA